MPGKNPWRYRCPDCSSVRLKYRLKRRRAKEVVQDTRFRTPNWTNKPFFCQGCNTPLEQVYDAKREREVYPGAVDTSSISRWKTGRREA